MEHLFIKIGSLITTVAVAFSSILFPIQLDSDLSVGATLPQAAGVFETTLQAPINASATSMTLSSNAIRGGGSIAGYTCFTIEEGSAQAEVVCGTVSSTSVTSMTRGISYSDGTTSVAANKFAHRRGVSVKITDFPILQILKAQNNGDSTFPNPLKYDTGIGPIASSDLADKEYVLSVASGGAVSFEKVVEAGIAGETVAAGQLVYYKTSDSRWWLTDADTASTVENVVLGIAQGAGTAGNAITGGVMKQGIDTNQSGLSANTVYYASNTAGGLSSSAGTKEVTVGFAPSTTTLVFNPRFNQQITEDEQDALAGGGDYGTPSASNKFLTAATLTSTTIFPNPIVRVYTSTDTVLGAADSQFDITNPSGTTFRYTWDGTGTDPSITSITVPSGSSVNLRGQNFHASNQGAFIVTASGTDYIEITNASGVAETNKTLGTGYISKGASAWTKPAGLKYITVEVQGAGGAGESAASASNYMGAGGGSGGYSKELIVASSLASSEAVVVGAQNNSATFATAKGSAFGTHLSTTGGAIGVSKVGGAAGTATGGDINISGRNGQIGFVSTTSDDIAGLGSGADSILGLGGYSTYDAGSGNQVGTAGAGYGSGGSGAVNTNDAGNNTAGGAGAAGVVIVTEHY